MGKATREYRVWDAAEEEALRLGVKKHGLGAWERIRTDPEFAVLQKRTGVQLKDKWRNLVKFRHISANDTLALHPKTSGPWSKKYAALGVSHCGSLAPGRTCGSGSGRGYVRGTRQTTKRRRSSAKRRYTYYDDDDLTDEGEDNDDDVSYGGETEGGSRHQEPASESGAKSSSDNGSQEEEEGVKARVGVSVGGDPDDTEYVVLCPCGVDFDDGHLMIECEVCKTWAHTACLRAQEEESPETYQYDFSRYHCHACQVAEERRVMNRKRKRPPWPDRRVPEEVKGKEAKKAEVSRLRAAQKSRQPVRMERGRKPQVADTEVAVFRFGVGGEVDLPSLPGHTSRSRARKTVRAGPAGVSSGSSYPRVLREEGGLEGQSSIPLDEAEQLLKLYHVGGMDHDNVDDLLDELDPQRQPASDVDEHDDNYGVVQDFDPVLLLILQGVLYRSKQPRTSHGRPHARQWQPLILQGLDLGGPSGPRPKVSACSLWLKEEGPPLAPTAARKETSRHHGGRWDRALSSGGRSRLPPVSSIKKKSRVSGSSFNASEPRPRSSLGRPRLGMPAPPKPPSVDLEGPGQESTNSLFSLTAVLEEGETNDLFCQPTGGMDGPSSPVNGRMFDPDPEPEDYLDGGEFESDLDATLEDLKTQADNTIVSQPEGTPHLDRIFTASPLVDTGPTPPGRLMLPPPQLPVGHPLGSHVNPWCTSLSYEQFMQAAAYFQYQQHQLLLMQQHQAAALLVGSHHQLPTPQPPPLTSLSPATSPPHLPDSIPALIKSEGTEPWSLAASAAPQGDPVVPPNTPRLGQGNTPARGGAVHDVLAGDLTSPSSQGTGTTPTEPGGDLCEGHLLQAVGDYRMSTPDLMQYFRIGTPSAEAVPSLLSYLPTPSSSSEVAPYHIHPLACGTVRSHSPGIHEAAFPNIHLGGHERATMEGSGSGNLDEPVEALLGLSAGGLKKDSPHKEELVLDGLLSEHLDIVELMSELQV